MTRGTKIMTGGEKIMTGPKKSINSAREGYFCISKLPSYAYLHS